MTICSSLKIDREPLKQSYLAPAKWDGAELKGISLPSEQLGDDDDDSDDLRDELARQYETNENLIEKQSTG